MAEVMLTTVDNPYDPFEDFEKWYIWDELNSVGRLSCCRIIGALCPTSVSLTNEENDRQIEQTIFEIVERDPTHQYSVALPGGRKVGGMEENDEKSEKEDKSVEPKVIE